MLLNRLTQFTCVLQTYLGSRIHQPWRIHRLWTPSSALLLLFVFTLWFSRAARAETITLPCDPNAAVNRQRLNDAITTANSTALSDTIVLSTNCFYWFDKPLVGNGVDALPVISQPLTIEGNNSVIGPYANAQPLRVLHMKANLTLHNVRLYGGILSGADWGGAVLAEPGTMLTLQDTKVYQGKAPYGGGIAALGNLTIIGGELRGNEATEKAGGAIYARGQVTITGSYIGQNDAAQYGGGLALDVNGGPAFIQDSSFSYNHAGSDGGAINAWSPVTIRGGDFYTNTATLQGGAIYAEAPLTLHDSSLRQNLAGTRGGALMDLEPLTITHTSLLDNQAKAEYGGALYASATVLLDRNVFEANHAPLAGTVLFLGQQHGQSEITNNLWLDNFTDGFPKQPTLCAPCDQFGGGSVALRHNTFVRSDKSAEVAVTINAGEVAAQYNIIVNHAIGLQRAQGAVNASRNLYFGNGQDEVNLTGSNNITGQDPKFVRPLLRDYRLAADSPGVDSAIGSTATLDLQGFQRPQHGIADIGAYELDNGEVPEGFVHKLTNCNNGDPAAFNALSEAITAANARPGRERIVLPAGCVYTYNHKPENGDGLPTITDALQIDGNGATISYRNDTPSILSVLRANSAALQVNNLTLINRGQTIDGRTCAVNLDTPYVPPATAQLDHVTIQKNICSWQGAALSAQNYSVQISNSRFVDNGLIDNESDTAVIDVYQSWLELDHSEVIGTAAPGDSRAVKVTNGGFAIHDNSFIANHAAYASGLNIDTNKLPSRLVNNIWLNNQPGTRDGAVVSIGNEAPLTVLNNTFANQTPITGNAILFYEPALVAARTQANLATDQTMTVTLYNTIFANISTSVAAQQPGRPVAISHNLFWHSAPVGDASTAISADPQFVDLANGDLHLQAASPAVDAGLPVDVTVDKDGVARPAGAGFDIGAYEFVTNATPTPTPSPSPTPEATSTPEPTPAPGELRAVDDGYLIASDTPLAVPAPGVLRNDNFSPGESVQAVLQQVGASDAGQLQLNADGSFTYTPAVGFTGAYRFVYTLQTGAQKSNQATVTINVIKAAEIKRLYLPVVRR
ncbi:MAG: choice-of-anchor Q domain-containing protein [Caldilineaceae bacterium]